MSVQATEAPATARAQRTARAVVPLLHVTGVLGAGALALWIAYRTGFRPRRYPEMMNPLDEALRAGGVAVGLFGVAGFGLTRLLLPAALRRYEPLWVVPVGACASALLLTVLGFAYVPFKLSLAIVIAAGVALGAVAVRARGAPDARGVLRSAWPAYLAVILAAIALIPYLRSGFPTVIGEGSDAHLAVGTAEFLQHNHPASVNPDGPVDRVPFLWRSKQPIYYALGGVATLSGLEPYETISPLAGLVLGLAAVGLFLLARELLYAGLAGALLAMAIAGLDRMVLHTGMHPYFNQTWGWFTLPFALVLSWWTVRERSRGAAVLLALFLALGAFAYPLALPIPLLGLAVFWTLDRRERRRRGEHVMSLDPRRLYRGRRSLIWLVPLGVLLAIPVLGVVEKLWTAAEVVLPGSSLEDWGGDLFGFVPAHQFFSLPHATLWWLAVAAMGVLAAWALSRVPRPLAIGLATVIVCFLAAAAYFRQRDLGWYFEFKALAFVAPLLVTIAAVGASRLRPRVLAVLALGAFLVAAQASARQELDRTTNQLPQTILGLRDFDRALPEGASVRLDVNPPLQIWVAYMMSGQPLCSPLPLLDTSYPHVPRSRRADYILIERKLLPLARGRHPDLAGPPVRENPDFLLYRARPGIPGPENCSRRMVQTVTAL
jgi:hypothetical protein